MSLQDFDDLGNGISVYNPPPSPDGADTCTTTLPHEHHPAGKQQDKPPPPALIILCTWLGGASPKRIQRYTQGYHALWPRSTILLIRTTAAEYACSGLRALRRRLGPARREIRRILAAGQHPESAPAASPSRGGVGHRRGAGTGMLLHMFSTGGANVATQLVASTNAALGMAGRRGPLALRQVVLDSCPGDLDVASTYRAAAHSVPAAHPLRPLLCALLYLVVAGLAGLEAAGLRRHLGRTIWDHLNDPAVFSPDAGRLYLISRADAIVDFRDVLSHRAEALARGLRAEAVVFQRAGHCSLVLEDEAAYWGAVQSSWERNEASPAEGEAEKHGSGSQIIKLPDPKLHTRSRL